MNGNTANTTMTVTSQERTARAVLTYLAAPGEQVLGAMARDLGAVRALEAIRTGSPADVTGQNTTPQPRRRVPKRLRTRLAKVPPPQEIGHWLRAMALRNHRRLLLEAGLPHPGRWEAYLEQADALIQRDPRKAQATTSRALKEDEEFRQGVAKSMGLDQDLVVFLAEVEANLQHNISEASASGWKGKLKHLSHFFLLRPRQRQRPRLRIRMLISDALSGLKRWLHPRYVRRRVRSASQRLAVGARASLLAFARFLHQRKTSLSIRFKANTALSQIKDPQEIPDYSYQQQDEKLMQARRALSDATNARKRIASQINSTHKQEIPEPVRQALTSLHDALISNEDRMRAAVSRLSQKLDSSRTQKEVFKATYTIAEAEGIREAMTAISTALSTFGMATRRAQDRTTYMQARAGAVSDALAPRWPSDVTSQSRVDIQAELNRINVDIGAELELLKREVEHDESDRQRR